MIGQRVIEDEIPRDGANGRDGLRLREAQPFHARCLQERQMDADAGEADGAEHQEAERHHVVGEFGDNQRCELDSDPRVEFAFTMLTLAKHVRYFCDAQLAARAGDEVDQNLESLRRQQRRQRIELGAAKHEETAHRVAQGYAQHPARNLARAAADFLAQRREHFIGTAAEMPAGDNEIEIAAAQFLHHSDQRGFIVLQIGVHHCDEARLARQHTLDARA